MQTSILRFPKADRFVRVHQSLMVACDRNACAAALIPFFESWHNYKAQLREYTEIQNAMHRDAGLQPIIDTSGWQHHTDAQLQAGIMLYSTTAIRAALELLEKKHFIDTDVPERLRILYKTGRTKWFLLRADNINAWFDSYEASLRPKQLVFPPRATPVRKEAAETPTGKLADDAMTVFEYRSRRRVEYWRTRGRKVQPAKVDAEQLKLIISRLQNGFTVLQLCHAWEGCLSSEFHQGLEPGKTKVHDSVDLVYKNAANVNRFIAYADTAGLRLKDTQERFENAAPAPEAADKYRAYHQRFGMEMMDFILTGTGKEQAWAEFLKRYRPDLPFKPELIEQYVREAAERKAGMYGASHKARWEEMMTRIRENQNVERKIS